MMIRGVSCIRTTRTSVRTQKSKPKRDTRTLFNAPTPVNEPWIPELNTKIDVNSPRIKALQAEIDRQKSEVLDIPLIIDGKEIRTGNTDKATIPHNHSHVLANFHKAGPEEIKQSIESSNKARKEWQSLPLQHRLSVFLKAAELLSGPRRDQVLAATMLNQSKNIFQGEIDSTCELIDFLRFNCKFAEEIHRDQPISSPGVWNRLEYRGLEGFVYAVSPFNFTAIGGNLVAAPAIMGTTSIWKPSSSAMVSNYYVYKIFEEAGLPPGVINFVPANAVEMTDTLLDSPDFGGVHFTGSSEVFQSFWQKIGTNISKYKTYPRIVGETGGKDFIFAHSSCDFEGLVTASIRGAFEYAGQKCSACSRVYIPKSLWGAYKKRMTEEMAKLKTGNPEEHDTFVNAVIHEGSFDKAMKYIEIAKNDPSCQIIAGGTGDKSVGYFVQPTLIQTSNPNSKLITEEIFAPILTAYVYEDADYDAALDFVDGNAYSLTGAIFARDRRVVADLTKRLENAAGNFYINDKPTGAVVGQQPFGGARLSGTNDKAGSKANLTRWTSMRTVKETFTPAQHWKYPYML